METPRWGFQTSGKGVEVNIRMMRTLSGLDNYGLFLADSNHTWRPKERRAFEKRVRELRSKRQ